MKPIAFAPRQALVILAATLASACLPIDAGSAPDTPTHEFRIDILDASWGSLQLGYEPDTAQKRLLEADRSAPLLSITDADITSIDWDAQVLTLTPAATEDLHEALKNATYGNQSALIEFYESMDYGNVLDRGLYSKAFIVSVDGETLYGGIFLDLFSEMAIHYPVMRIWEGEGGAARLALLPTHLPFSLVDDPRSPFAVPQTDAFRERIHDDRIRELFDSQDKLIHNVDGTTSDS